MSDVTPVDIIESRMAIGYESEEIIKNGGIKMKKEKNKNAWLKFDEEGRERNF